MINRRLLQQGFVLTLILSLMAGCSGAPVEPEAQPTPVPPTTIPTATTAAGPPCYGLAQAENLPDWAGGFAFGESHSSGNRFTDLTSVVGCEVEGGVILINKDGRFFGAYVKDCQSFESSDIPAQELRPASGQRWVCNQPTADGGMQYMQREG